jgi:hypothetical protein
MDRFDVMLLCTPMATGPNRTQPYCHCDFSLSGPNCSEITGGAVFRIVVFLACAAYAALPVAHGVVEIYHRSKPLKVNPVYVSLCLSLAGCLFNVLWGVVGAVTIFGATNNTDLSALRIFFINAAIPGTMACPFAAAMVIMLAWRKVVIASDLKSNKNKQALQKREENIRNVVVVLCVVMFMAIAISLAFVSVSMALMLLVAFNIIGGAVFSRSGRAFQKNMSSTFGTSSNPNKNAKLTPEEQCLRAAGDANKLVIIGMFLVVLGSVLTLLAQKYIGMPGVVGEIEIAGLTAAMIAIGVGLLEIAIVRYSRQVRMIGVKRRKNLKSARPGGAGASSDATSSATSSGVATETPVVEFKSNNKNKVAPAKQ